MLKITCKKFKCEITHSINSLLQALLSMGPKSLKLAAATTAIAVILFAANITVTNAAYDQEQSQQQSQQEQGLVQLFLQQLLTSESGTVQNQTTTYQSTNNGFRIHVPQGWIIQDLSTTGFTLAAEILQGYGLLAQLCPPEQQALLVSAGSNSSNVSNSTNNNDGCESAQEIVHVVRYPNLGARVEFASEEEEDDNNNNGPSTANNSNTTPDAVLGFELLKLQEAGYRDIKIVSSTDRTINVISPILNNNIIATIPAKFVELTYSTNLVPNETRTGYFLSTATDLTARNLGLTTGYGILYESNSFAAAGTTASSGLSLSAPVTQVFDSFELIPGPEVEQAIVAQLQGLVAPEAEVVEASADILTVDIDSNDTEGVAPATFELGANIKRGTEPYTVNWDLDDDGIVDSNEQNIAVTFGEAGTYNVVLTVVDAEGQIASDSVKIKVQKGEEMVSTVEEKGEELDQAENEDESSREDMTQKETSCNFLYPATCLRSNPEINPDSAEPDNNNFVADSLRELYGSGST
jgi:PKD repeat protein